MQKRGALQADVDECGVHAGEYTRDLAQVHITHHVLFASAFNVKLGDDSILDERDARLANIDVDHNLVTGHSATRSDLQPCGVEVQVSEGCAIASPPDVGQ